MALVCLKCRGRGEVPVRISAIDGIDWGTCPECEGTGEVDDG